MRETIKKSFKLILIDKYTIGTKSKRRLAKENMKM